MTWFKQSASIDLRALIEPRLADGGIQPASTKRILGHLEVSVEDQLPTGLEKRGNRLMPPASDAG